MKEQEALKAVLHELSTRVGRTLTVEDIDDVQKVGDLLGEVCVRAYDGAQQP